MSTQEQAQEKRKPKRYTKEEKVVLLAQIKDKVINHGYTVMQLCTEFDIPKGSMPKLKNDALGISKGDELLSVRFDTMKKQLSDLTEKHDEILTAIRNLDDSVRSQIASEINKLRIAQVEQEEREQLEAIKAKYANIKSDVKMLDI